MANKNGLAKRASRKQAPVRALAAIAVGVGGFYGGRYASSKVDALQEHWYAVPAALAVGGYALQHFAPNPLRTKGALMQGAGVGAIGAGAMLGTSNYELTSASREAAGVVGSSRWDTRGVVSPGRGMPTMPGEGAYDDFDEPQLPPPAPAPAPVETGRIAAYDF